MRTAENTTKSMKLKNQINKILIISVTFIFVIVFAFYFMYSKNEVNEFVCKIPVPTYFCGTKNLPKEVEKGRQLFNQTCAACHKLNMKSTGPALAKTDSVKYWKWISKNDVKVDSVKFKQFKFDFHQNLSREILSSKDINEIFKYINTEY